MQATIATTSRIQPRTRRRGGGWWTVLGLAIPVPLFCAALGVVLWIPCHDSLFIGGCELGRALEAIAAGGALIWYIILSLATSWFVVSPGRRVWLPRIVAVAGLITGLGAFGLAANEARVAPDLAPERLPALQARGRDEVSFALEDLTPIAGANPGSVSAYRLIVSATVAHDGLYRVGTLSAAGPVAVLTFDPSSQRPARAMNVALEANTPTVFVYDLRFAPGVAGGVADHNQCSWSMSWQITQVPPFPIYLFGQGLVATAHPYDAQQVTHVVPEFAIGPIDCDRVEVR